MEPEYQNQTLEISGNGTFYLLLLSESDADWKIFVGLRQGAGAAAS